MKIGNSVLWLRVFVLIIALSVSVHLSLVERSINALPAGVLAAFYVWLVWEALRRRNDTE